MLLAFLLIVRDVPVLYSHRDLGQVGRTGPLAFGLLSAFEGVTGRESRIPFAAFLPSSFFFSLCGNPGEGFTRGISFSLSLLSLRSHPF